MSVYLRNVDNEWFKERLIGVVFCTVFVFVVLFIRLFYLQVVEGEEYRRLSLNNCIRLQDIDPPRGLIFDRDAHLLVDNRPAFNLNIVLKDAKPVADTLAKLADYTGHPLKDFRQRIKRSKHIAPYKPILLEQDISRETVAAIEVHRFDLPGVVVDVKPRRHYVEEGSAAHLLGYLSEISGTELKSGRYPDNRPGDFIGKFGVEKTYESYLRGKRGGRQVEVDATGRVVRPLKTVPATPGNNLYLTVIHRVQRRAEQLLSGSAGAVVALEPTSGRLLALASSPSYNQNAFVDGMSYRQWEKLKNNPQRPMENKAIQGEYPPASTYKIITAIAALEEGVIDATTSFNCPGYLTFGDRTFRCWKKGGHGTLQVVEALAESCDVFFYQVGQKLGVDRLAWYAKAAGLGRRTGIQLDHESQGLVPTAKWKKARYGVPWQSGETLSVAIGQGYDLVTPIQMAVMMSAVANGGTLYRPQILNAIKTAEGKTVLQTTPEVTGRLPVSPETLAIVRRGLYEVVNGPKGTARGVQLKHIAISGKTGTAQVVGRRSDEEDADADPVLDKHLDHAWFVAYAPSEAPRIAVAVIVEHGEHGSSAAAPIAREVIRAYLEPDSGAPALN